MEKCVLCGKEFPSRSAFDHHPCQGVVRPTRRPVARWAFEVSWLTTGLAGAFFVAHRTNWGGPVVLGAIFVLYTAFTVLSVWGLFKIHPDDAPQWVRHTMARVQFRVFYEWHGGPLIFAGLLIVFWCALLTLWF